jgi:hypothetical protein
MTCSGHCISQDFREIYPIVQLLHAIFWNHFHPDGDAQAIRMFFLAGPGISWLAKIWQEMTQVVAR